MFLDEALKKEPKSLQETFHTWYDFWKTASLLVSL